MAGREIRTLVSSTNGLSSHLVHESQGFYQRSTFQNYPGFGPRAVVVFDRFRFEGTCDNSLSTSPSFSIGWSRALAKIDGIGSTGYASIAEDPVYVRNSHGRIIDRVDARQEVRP